MIIKNKKQWDAILKKENIIYIDIFDTVIIRNYASTVNIYELMEKHFYDKMGLSIILSKILEELEKYGLINKYEKLHKLGFEKNFCSELKDEELRLIQKYSCAREWFKKEYIYFKHRGKQFRFINNSNIPNDIVNVMLRESGYQESVYIDEYDSETYEIYSESESYAKGQLDIALDEASGNLLSFDKLINSNGFKEVKLLLINKLFDNPFKDWKKDSISNSELFVVGYYYLAMHILGVILWLSEIIKNKKSNTIYFCSRDGFLYFKAYQLYCKYVGAELPRAEYLYISRKMLLPSLYSDKRDFLQLPDHYSQFSPKTTVLLFWDFNLYSSDDEYRYEDYIKYESVFAGELSKINIDYFTNFNSWEQYYLFISWFLDNYYSPEKHKKRLSELKDYYSRIGSKDYVFDLGYSGRLQWGVSRICSNNFNVLYVMPDTNIIGVIQERGLEFNTYYDFPFSTSNVFREFLVSEACPSYVGITLRQNTVLPKYESDPQKFKKSEGLSVIQEASIKAVEDILKTMSMDIKHFHINPKVLSLPWEGYIRNVPKVDLELYDDLYQEEYHTGKFVYSSWKERYLAEHSEYPEVINISSRVRVRLKKINSYNKRIVLFGAGRVCQWFLDKYKYLSLAFIVDNDYKKQGNFVDGLPVFSLNQISDLSLYFFVIVVKDAEEIKQQLRDIGLHEDLDFIWYRELEV